MDKKSSEMINEILDQFNFELVHEYMARRGWTYSGHGIPSIGELRSTAINVLTLSLKDKVNVSTGGFYANYSNGMIELVFGIEGVIRS